MGVGGEAFVEHGSMESIIFYLYRTGMRERPTTRALFVTTRGYAWLHVACLHTPENKIIQVRDGCLYKHYSCMVIS